MWTKYFSWFKQQSPTSMLKAYAQSTMLEGFGYIDVEDNRTVHMNDLELLLKRTNNHIQMTADYCSLKDNPLRSKASKIAMTGPGHEALYLYPQLPDRLIFVPLTSSLIIAANTSITVTINTPLWLKLGLSDKLITLIELPTVQMKEAWLGKLPMDGRFAYHLDEASLHLAPSSPDKYYVNTQITFENQRKSPVTLSNIIIPMPHMALFLNSEGHHKTSKVKWIFTNAMDPKLVLTKITPSEGASLVQVARSHPSALMLSDIVQLSTQL